VTSRSGDTGVTSKTNAVALICSDHGDALMGRVILGVSRALRARRQELLVLDSDHDAQREAELLRELPWRGIGGALLWPIAPVENRDVVRSLQDQRFPLVLIDRGIDGLDLPVVSVDHERGAYEVTQHLITQGHRRIAHITARVDEKNPSPAVAAREAGYRRALEEAGIVFEDWMIERVDPALMHMAHEPSLRSVMAYQQAHRLLARKDRPTAIFMLNDVFYPSVLAAARNQGLNVPEDVALAGFNNDPDAWSEVVPLTSYNQPTSEVGFEAADILRQLVEGQVVEPPNRTFAGHLVVRASSDFKRR
jgi:LacI family transcriptional regulator